MDDTVSDEALMIRFRDGDTQAFEVLYARHKGPLYRYLCRQCETTAHAEELFQDVWMKLIGARDHYEVRAKFATYLYHLAHNRLIDHYRRAKTGIPISYDDDAEERLLEQVPDAQMREPENDLDRRRLGKRLLKHISALPGAQRETFLLREEAGLSLAEIAAATGVNAETAKSRLRYALARLRRELAEE